MGLLLNAQLPAVVPHPRPSLAVIPSVVLAITDPVGIIAPATLKAVSNSTAAFPLILMVIAATWIGKLPIRRRPKATPWACHAPCPAVGQVRLKDRRALLTHLRPAGVGGKAGAAKMVAMQIREHAALYCSAKELS